MPELDEPTGTSPKDEAAAVHPPLNARFPVVGIGASAGGLEALRHMFGRLPAETGMAFVVIQHLAPDRPSILTGVLQSCTSLPVVEVTSGMQVVPDRVHVIPSGSDLTIRAGCLELVERRATGGLHLPIDGFFRSLAEDNAERSIGVVLSGSGADGTEGLRAIKAAGGISLVQEPESAQFRSMPESAIAAGVVDFCGGPDRIADALVRLGQQAYLGVQGGAKTDSLAHQHDDDRKVEEALALVRENAGADFAGYKRTTVQRRIERRMALRDASTLDEYLNVLREDVGEAKELAHDMLIHVTSFFRDPDAFEALKHQVFAEVVQRKSNGDPIRIWVPGCATGEEAYAVTICLLEAFDGESRPPPIKVFGSDLSNTAIETARLARYSDAALADVAPERVSRFFERVDGGYRIGKRLRDLVVFVKHDLTRDPPFAKLDLVSCRNVLIYFDSELQRRVVPMLHYCLSKHGYLFLGKSESITGFRDLFATVDKEQRIFVKTGESTRLSYPFPTGRDADVKASTIAPAERRQPAREAGTQADHLLLSRYAPPGVIVNDRLEIVQFRGRTGAYLEPAPGQPQSNVLRMAKDGLAAHLHDSIERAKAQSTSVRKERLRVRDGAYTSLVNLEVFPLTALPDSEERFYLILFEEPEAKPAGATVPVSSSEPGDATAEAAEVQRLKDELLATKDYLQSIVAEHQDSTDELAAANEELVAANEELQSTNEELQSAKEELQSTNEELGTVNDQLRTRNHELDEIANDMVNVLASVEIPVFIVDLQLRLRRFTPTAGQVARLIPEDLGRPIDDIKLKVEVDELPAKIKGVIDGLAPKQWEVKDHEGHWFRLQIRPYRTTDNRLDGAVLSFVDVDALKHALDDAERARDYARGIVETVTSALVVLDGSLRVVSVNGAFREMFGGAAPTPPNVRLFDLAGGLFDEPAVHRALKETLAKHTRFTGVEIAAELAATGRRIMSLTGRPILLGDGAPMILLALDDVTSLRALEAERAELLESERQARVAAERANRAKDLFLATLSHELRTPLSTMLLSAQVLQRVAVGNQAIQRASAAIQRAATAQSRLIDDLLDVSRIVSGKLILDMGPVDLAGTVHEAVDIARSSAEAKALDLSLTVDGEIGLVYGDHARLLQVVNNLLTNAIKFTPHGGRIAVRLEHADGRARITVADSGIGVRAEVLPHLFSRFVQADSTATRVHGGLGLGLSIVRHLVEVHRGEVHAESAGEGKGATFTVTLPLGMASAAKGTIKRLTAHDTAGVKVLLVEDDEDTRDACAMLLAELGAEVRAVPSAAMALAALDEFRPDAIISDIAMPGEDGFSFIRKVRLRDPKNGGRIPAAALTALASDEDRQRAMQSGFQLHVAKPVDASRLAAVVSTLAEWPAEKVH